jgi:hypothetical protein
MIMTSENTQIKNLSFGEALDALKKGYRIAREGWNGKGMFVFLNKGSHAGEHSGDNKIDGISNSPEMFELGDIGTSTRLPNINMRAASGATVTGWLASQTDLLADDWIILAT